MTQKDFKVGDRVETIIQSLAAGATMDYVVEGTVIEVNDVDCEVEIDEPIFRTHQGWISRFLCEFNELSKLD